MALNGFYNIDNNNNQWPLVYAGAINSGSTVPFRVQVNARFNSLREEGFRVVPAASYFDNFHCDHRGLHEMYDYITEFIMEMVRRRANLPDDRQEYDIVFVWEIKDISMLSCEHFAELKTLQPNVNLNSLYTLQECILKKSNFTSLEYSEVESVGNVEDVLTGETDQMREFRQKYENLRQLYNEHSGGIRNADLLEKVEMSSQVAELGDAVKQHQKIFHKRWKYVKKCLELVNRRSAEQKDKKYANVVLCDHGIALGMAQLLTSQHSSVFPVENIFSTFDVDYEGRKSVFDRIQQRFGKKCYLVAVSSGPVYGNIEVCQWPIRANESVKLLYTALKEVLLK